MTEEQKEIIFAKYAKLICNAADWHSVAQSLYATAIKLEPEISRLWKDLRDLMFVPGHVGDTGPLIAAHYQRVYLMLISYSLENLLKGFLVGQFSSQFHDESLQTGSLPSILKTHNLETLAKKCPLDLNEEQSNMLHRLTSHAEWIGRYPYPAKAADYYTFNSANLTTSNAIGWSSDEMRRIKELVDEIAEQLGTTLYPERGGNL